MLSLREMIRNGFDHAMAPHVWYSGMRWPNRGYVQVAIVDEGRGIRTSLNRGGYSFPNDETAIDAALRPGVSRNVGRRLSAEEVERWSEARPDLPVECYQNSGYGLPIASRIGQEGGQFLVISGNKGRQFIRGDCLISTFHQGTAIRMVLHPERVRGVVDRVFEELGGSNRRKGLISASMRRRLGVDEGTRNAGE